MRKIHGESGADVHIAMSRGARRSQVFSTSHADRPTDRFFLYLLLRVSPGDSYCSRGCMRLFAWHIERSPLLQSGSRTTFGLGLTTASSGFVWVVVLMTVLLLPEDHYSSLTGDLLIGSSERRGSVSRVLRVLKSERRIGSSHLLQQDEWCQ